MNTRYPLLFPLTWMLAMIMSLFLLAGCSGSATRSDSTAQGKLAISLTDAAGDFIHYKVDVIALKLYRVNGAVVETLPATTTLDFAQYIDVSEFLTTATVPSGTYRKAEITLDYSHADIQVENADGVAIPATALDDAGKPLTVVTLSTEINAAEGFVIHRGQPASLALDFDLQASNQVTIASDGATATISVNPVLIANTSINNDKIRRLHGLIDSVNVAEQSLVVDIRPFRVRKHSYGQVSVQVDDATVYEIDGVSYNATEGLPALAALDPFSPVVTRGKYDFTRHRYLASEVYAGSSVAWNNKDAVKGSVIARRGNTLTILGATLELHNGRFLFNDVVSVAIDAATRVNKQGSNNPASIADISVGQRVMILGHMTGPRHMDASHRDDIVRLRYSDISGNVVSASPLQIKLQTINRRNVQRFDFSGTGIDTAHDADLNRYEVNSTTLNLNQVNSPSPLRVRGYPTPFGSAPADFNAKTVIDVSQTLAMLYVGYGAKGSDSAITSLDDSGLQLNLDASSGRHVIKQNGVVTDLTSLSAMPLIVPADGQALYALNAGHRLAVYRNWADFEQALNGHLDAGAKVKLVTSKGRFDPVDNSINSRAVMVRLTK